MYCNHVAASCGEITCERIYKYVYMYVNTYAKILLNIITLLTWSSSGNLEGRRGKREVTRGLGVRYHSYIVDTRTLRG